MFQTTSVPWSILSPTLTLNESSPCENITLIELDPHCIHSLHKDRRGSATTAALSFSRPRALLSRPDELQARMNLMHLHEVVQPKILSSSISINFPNSTMPQSPRRRPVSSRRRAMKIDLYRSINTPKHSRSNKSDSPVRRLKRRSTTPDLNKRRKKAPRTDENQLVASDGNTTDGDHFPSLRQVLDQLIDPPLTPEDNSSASSAERSSSAEIEIDDNDSSDDDDEMLSYRESQFDHHYDDVRRVRQFHFYHD